MDVYNWRFQHFQLHSSAVSSSTHHKSQTIALRRPNFKSIQGHALRSYTSLSTSSNQLPGLQIPHSADKNSVTALHAQPLASNADIEESARIVVDNDADRSFTTIQIIAPNRPGHLAFISAELKALELRISKTSVDLNEGFLFYEFLVTDAQGHKLLDLNNLQNVENALQRVLSPALWSELGKGVDVRSSIEVASDREFQRRRRLLWLMDQYLKNDVLSIQKSIVDHVEYTIARSRFNFDDFEAYKVHCLTGLHYIQLCAEMHLWRSPVEADLVNVMGDSP